MSAPDHRSALIDSINARLDAVDLPRALPLTVSKNDVTLHHWLFLPARSASALPMIVVPYPGDVFSADTPPPVNPGAVAPIANVPLLTALGFAVLYPSIPASSEQPPSLKSLASAITAAVDAAIASGHVDRSRMAVWRHSFGGYSALAVAAYDHRFKATIVSSAPIDLLAGYGSLDPRDRVSLKSGMNLPFTYGWSEGGHVPLKSAIHRRHSDNGPTVRHRSEAFVLGGVTERWRASLTPTARSIGDFCGFRERDHFCDRARLRRYAQALFRLDARPDRNGAVILTGNQALGLKHPRQARTVEHALANQIALEQQWSQNGQPRQDTATMIAGRTALDRRRRRDQPAGKNIPRQCPALDTIGQLP